MAMNLTTQASLLATIKDVMSYKGSKATYQEILDLTDMVKGDIWGCTEVGHLGFFLYNGADWELFGSDSTKAVTLDSEQTITGLKTFDNTVDFTSQVYFSNALQIKDTSSVAELTIEPAANSIIINLSDKTTLTMNDIMISELKRILGIS